LLKIQTQITEATRQEANDVAAHAKGLSIALLLAAIGVALAALYTVQQGNRSLRRYSTQITESAGQVLRLLATLPAVAAKTTRAV